MVDIIRFADTTTVNRGVWKTPLIKFFLNLSRDSVDSMNHFGMLNQFDESVGAYGKLVSPFNEYVTYLAVVGSAVWGIGFLKIRNMYVWTLGIIVADFAQHKGVGWEIMESLVKHARESGVKKIWLNVYAHNQPAIALYKRFGFVQEGYFKAQEYNGDTPLDVISMGLFLN